MTDDLITKFSLRACDLTGGHPFWVNIIAAQASVDPASAGSLMDDLSRTEASVTSSQSDHLAEKMLSAVWQRLNEKNRTLLKAMGEAVCEENLDQLKQILEKELNHNAITKSIRKLKQINLVVVKSSSNSSVEYFDLHPLVRRFVRGKASKEQRHKYISFFVAYFDKIINTLRSRVNHKSSLSDFRHWSYKIELESRRSKFSNALASLNEISAQLKAAGFVEEYIRLAELVLGQVEWQQATSDNLQYFDSQVCMLSTALSELGRYTDADEHLTRLSGILSESGLPYLRLCNARTKRYWDEDRFEEAIKSGREAKDLKNSTTADLDIDVSHNYALALRDSRQVDNLKEALSIFLKGYDLEAVVANSLPEGSGSMHFFGNVGRCLQFLGQNSEALKCYGFSLQLGANAEDTWTRNNKAFAFWWIAEIFEANNSYHNAANFYRCASLYWSKISPPRSRRMEHRIELLLTYDPSLTSVRDKSEIEINRFCENRLSQLF